MFLALVMAWGLLCYGTGWAQSVRIQVDLQAGVPDIVELYYDGPDGSRCIDSAWQGPDGYYKLQIANFASGFYRLAFGMGQEKLCLYLRSPEPVVWVRTYGAALLDSVHVEGAPEAEIYLRAQQAARGHALWHEFATRVRAEGCGEAILQRGIDSLKSLADSLFLKRLVELQSQCVDSGTWWLLELQRPVMGVHGDEWWGAGALLDGSLAMSRELGWRLEDYLLAQKSASYRRKEQDSAYWNALLWLSAQRMDAAVARRLRGQIVYLFSGTEYDALADSVMLHPFGGLPAVPSRGVVRPGVPPRDMLSMRCRNLDGKRIPMVDAKSDYTLLVFWSAWCSHCQELLPQLHSYWRGLSAGRLAVRTISLDQYSKGLVDHTASRGWRWDNVDCRDAVCTRLVDGWGVDGSPELLLFDREGRFVGRMADIHQLRNELAH